MSYPLGETPTKCHQGEAVGDSAEGKVPARIAKSDPVEESASTGRKAITVRQSIIRNKTLFVGADVFRGLQALAMRSIDPLCDCADAVGDQMLRDALAAMPEAAERTAKIEAFFKELNKPQP